MTAPISARAVTRDHNQSWTLDRVVFAILPAQSKAVALPQATGIFNTKLGGSRDLPTSGDNYDLVEDIEIATPVQEAWGNLSGSIPLTSEDGQEVLSQIKSQLNTPHSSMFTSKKRPHLYGKFGEELSLDEVADYSDSDLEDGKRYWIVPALAYVIKKSAPDNAEDLFCNDCSSETPHTFTGREGTPEWATDIHHSGGTKTNPVPLETVHLLEEAPGRPIWECWECNKGQFGPEPAALDDQPLEKEHDQNVNIQAPDGAQIPSETTEPEVSIEDFPKFERGPEEAHEYHLQQLEDRGQNVPKTTSQNGQEH